MPSLQAAEPPYVHPAPAGIFFLDARYLASPSGAPVSYLSRYRVDCMAIPLCLTSAPTPRKFNTVHDSIIAACQAEACAAVASFRPQGTLAHLDIGPKTSATTHGIYCQRNDPVEPTTPRFASPVTRLLQSSPLPLTCLVSHHHDS